MVDQPCMLFLNAIRALGSFAVVQWHQVLFILSKTRDLILLRYNLIGARTLLYATARQKPKQTLWSE